MHSDTYRPHKALIQGTLSLAAISLVAYTYPFDWPLPGIRRQQAKLKHQKELMKLVKTNYVSSFDTPDPSVWGEMSDGQEQKNRGEGEKRPPSARPSNVRPLATLIGEYQEKVSALENRIQARQSAGRMHFPAWTDLPEDHRWDRGFYFARTYERVRNELISDLAAAGIQLDDPTLGFETFTGVYRNFSKNKSEAYLRQLYIAEKVIRLCVAAQQDQAQTERKTGPPEAFMRILSVAPETPVASGPSKLVRNPKWSEKETNPRSNRFPKFNVKQWAPFIVEYPIRFLIQCDVDSLMRFLYSVRQKGQFLVIRNLQIISPTLAESQMDTSELDEILALAQKRGGDPMDHHVWAKITAAGMDFDKRIVKRYKTKRDARDEDRQDKKALKKGVILPAGI